MRVSNLLSKLYNDKCDVYRTEDVKVGSITRQKRVKKLESIQCRLSNGSSNKAGDNVVETTSKHKLFTDDNADIRNGDEIHILRKGKNKAVVYIADEPFVYHGSHLEVELSRSDYE